MSDVARTQVRLRRRVRAELGRLRAAPVTVVSAAGVGLVAIALVATADESSGWPGLIKGFASNAAAAAILAVFAYVIFVLRFRRARLSEYLDRHRATGEDDEERPVPRVAHDALVNTVVDELLTARPPRSCLLVGPADIARSSALEELPALLTERGRVPIVVDLSREGGISSLPACTRQRFIGEFAGSAGDDAAAGRVFAQLISQERAVAVVTGLDTLNEGLSKRARREALDRLLRGCLTERLPVVATLSDELAPAIGEIAVLRIPPAARSELATHLIERLSDRGLPVDVHSEESLTSLFAGLGAPTRDPFLLELAADLAAARVRRGESLTGALAELFEDQDAFRRHVGWMCERVLGCRTPEAAASQSPIAFALRAIGLEAHFRQDLPTSWDDASRGLGEEERRRFTAGVSELAQKDIVSVEGDGGGAILRFAHAGWLAFAGGLGVGTDPERWRTLLRPGAAQATLDALTVALLLEGVAPERSFLAVLDRVADCDDAAVSLDVALAVIATLQLEEGPLAIGEREIAALTGSWRASTDPVRLAFVAGVDFARAPLLLDFLWAQVVAPAFRFNSFRVRRAVCARLAALGPVAWGHLRGTWLALTADALGRDLSALAREEPDSDWERFGLAVASLCWVVPSLVVELDGDDRAHGLELLRGLRAVAQNGWEGGAPVADATDIGIEISLAEGFKIAATRAAGARRSLEDWWWEEARDAFESAESWISEQALLQALALADREEGRVDELARWTTASESRHPFVRETAALVLRDLESPAGHTHRQQYVWLDDIEALHDGGLELVPAAHRLLGLSTLLINFAENAFQTRDAGAASRVRAFTSSELPRCFRRASHAATMYEPGFECDCEFRLCGETALGRVGGRRFSRAFVKRAEASASSPVVAESRLFARHAFRDAWRALDEKLATGRDP